MSYGVELGQEVKQLLRELPGEIGENVLDHIDQLAEQPTRLSRSSGIGSSIYNAQLFDFTIQTAEAKYVAVVQFRYSQDEQSLHIERVDINKE